MLANHPTPDTRVATVRHREVSDGVQYAVYDQGDIRWLGTSDGAVQAAVQLSAPTTPIMQYIRTMLSGLALTPRVDRVLDLGYGCGTLASSVRTAFPNARIVSVDSSHAMVTLAHRWLGGAAPERILMTRAERFLSQPQLPVSAIFCDLHAGRSEGSPILDDAFHASAARALKEDGVYVLNLLPRDEADAVALLKPIRSHFPHLWLSPVIGCQNLVVHARKTACKGVNRAAPFADVWTPALLSHH